MYNDLPKGIIIDQPPLSLYLDHMQSATMHTALNYNQATKQRNPNR